jgi:hypothetical membrane protein
MKGQTAAVALLADAPTLARPTARSIGGRRSSPASHVGFATFAFLAAGLLLAIATTPDPLWWHLHFSQLGTFSDFSGHVFNTTIVLTSVGVVLFALRVRVEMKRHAGTARLANRRSATVVPILIALIGIHLSVVGFVPVNANEFLHDRGSTGAVLSFMAILASSRWMLRGMHGIVARTTRRVAIGLMLTIAPYIAGFINLAAFELIVFTLVFCWLLVFARAVGRPADDPAPSQVRTGSMHLTVVVPSRAHTEHVAIAARGPVAPSTHLRPAGRPRRSTVRPRRRATRGHSARQPDPEHPGTRRARLLTA